MISCLLTTKDNDLIMRMFKKKARLQQEALSDPGRVEAHLRQRNLIIQFVLDKLGPAVKARIKTWTARKYCEEADAESLVYEHVVMAVDKYKPERGKCRFTSFLWTVSNRAFSNFLSAARRQKRDPHSASVAQSGEELFVPIDGEVNLPHLSRERILVSLDETVSAHGALHSPITLADIVPDSSQVDDSLNFSMMVDTIDRRCTDQQRTILVLLQQNYTYKEIAKHLGTTPGTVSRQIQQLRKKLRHELRNYRV